jgi:hypothetical protein
MIFNVLNRFVLEKQRALVPVLLTHRAALALCSSCNFSTSSSTRPFAAAAAA